MLFKQLCHPPSPVGVFHLELPQPKVEQAQSAPMNWVLGPTSCRFMLHDARALGSNPQETERLRVRLNAQAVPDWQQDAAKDGTRCLPESGGTTQ
jgi:hypothetical protein